MLVFKADGSKWIADPEGLLPDRPYRWYHGLADWLKHRWYSRGWNKVQRAFKCRGTRFYGDGGTVHGSTHLDVETHNGQVVSVWFRCQMLPFKQHEVNAMRALEMRKHSYKVELHGLEVKDVEAE
jgi:hypothetical protein